uniref:Uncharacterized protein n=1 Tax=Opuntia streptacantha TaxID=393608 RepID=A0A7C8YYD7_OPUST
MSPSHQVLMCRNIVKNQEDCQLGIAFEITKNNQKTRLQSQKCDGLLMHGYMLQLIQLSLYRLLVASCTNNSAVNHNQLRERSTFSLLTRTPYRSHVKAKSALIHFY